jgi:hypothetical protein
MANPWIKLESSRNGYALDEDLRAIDDFNLQLGESTANIVFDPLPEPYIGNPDLAKVVFLGLNPGYSASDPHWHARKDFPPIRYRLTSRASLVAFERRPGASCRSTQGTRRFIWRR